MLESLARILRQKRVIQTLLPEVAKAIVELVPCDWVRFDLTDEQGRLWTRFVRPGSEPERPGLGEVPRLGSRESEYVRTIEGGFEACVLLGIGEPSGRLIVRRKTKPYDEDLSTLRSIADVVSLGFRARPFEPPPKPRSPFEEGPLV